MQHAVMVDDQDVSWAVVFQGRTPEEVEKKIQTYCRTILDEDGVPCPEDGDAEEILKSKRQGLMVYRPNAVEVV